MALDAVIQALKKLTNNNSTDDGNSLDSGEHEDQTYFCVEDVFPSKDINVTVEGVGSLSFPISVDTVNSLINISSKAKFGRGEVTILDTSVRDTQMIPASKLKVEINENSLKNTVERIALGLNVHQNSTLVPHLFNMLIYGPGQFFSLHKDSEKVQNMVATLVVVLPSPHKGGDLVVQHKNKQHVFFGSQNPDFIKCVMFYSDCQHEIKKVTEGFRIALTYNVVLQSPEIVSSTHINQELNEAVRSYFHCPSTPKRLIYYLNHNYSEHSLKWNLLKGTDRKEALSLFTVAKHQGLVPCLALLDYNETYDVEDDSYLINDETCLFYWVDEKNTVFIESIFNNAYKDEICYTMETTDLLEPYKTEESGPTGNEGETRDHWYRRACVVLWSKKQSFAYGYKSLLCDLHNYTTKEGNETVLLDEIKKIGSDFFQKKFWTEPVVIEMLLDIVIYLNDTSIAVSILSKIPEDLLSEDRIHCLMQLENQYDDETWTRVFESWKALLSWYSIVKNSYSNMKKFFKVSIKFTVAHKLLEETVETYIRSNTTGNNQYVYGSVKDGLKERLLDIFHDCFELEKLDLVDKLFHFTLNSCNVHNLVSLASLLLKLKFLLSPSQFLYCKTYRDRLLKAMSQEIEEASNSPNDWRLPHTISCRCEHCSKVQDFFLSKSVTRLVVPAAKHIRRHVYSFLNPLAGRQISFNTERTGRPYKIIIEKNQSLLLDREQYLKDLKSSKKSLEQLVFIETLFSSNDGSTQGVISSNNLPAMQVVGEENASNESTSECAIKRLKRN